jgi:acetoin utilization protein AcuC
MRHHVFEQAFYKQSLQEKVDVLPPQSTDQSILELFHTHDYVEQVKQQSIQGTGFLDQGDTPAFVGMFEAASSIVGTVCNAVDRLMNKEYKRAFIPIAGLHHARRHIAAGFCVFNDCGVAIEYIRHQYNIQRIAYIDIDAHHGDGVFYSFEDDPNLIFADLHEDGRFLYPGTGAVTETGIGAAKGTKLNLPMLPESNDDAFMQAWETGETFLLEQDADFILLQCGADSIKGDPITHMAYSEKSHAYAAERLCKLANQMCKGRLIAMGGGGYNHENIAKTWTAVVESMAQVSY